MFECDFDETVSFTMFKSEEEKKPTIRNVLANTYIRTYHIWNSNIFLMTAHFCKLNIFLEELNKIYGFKRSYFFLASRSSRESVSILKFLALIVVAEI